MVKRLRVAILADYLEEEWPSMDLVADMLYEHLRREHAPTVEPTLVRPPMPRRLTRLPLVAAPAKASILDRALARQWDYPRALGAIRGRFDVYHVVDHTYAHLVHALPADRTVVTCHDVDAFRSILQPEDEQRSAPYRWMSARILAGLRVRTLPRHASALTQAGLALRHRKTFLFGLLISETWAVTRPS